MSAALERKRQPQTQLSIDGTAIEYSRSIKYLGIWLDQKMNFAEHITKVNSRAMNTIRSLYPLIGWKSKLSIKNKQQIYTAIIRPIITYGSAVWRGAAKTNIKKLQIIQNKCLKIIHNLHWRHSTDDVHLRAALPLLSEFINESFHRFNSRNRESDFELIRNLYE